MFKMGHVATLSLAVALITLSATAATGQVLWDGGSGTAYWNDPVPADGNDWGNWDSDPNPGSGVDLDLGSSDTKIKSDLSGWAINAIDLWPASGTATLTIEDGGYLDVGHEIRFFPHNDSTTQVLVTGGVLDANIVYGGYIEISGTGTWTGGRTYSGPSVHVIGSEATVTPTRIAHSSPPAGPYMFTLDAGGVSPIAFTSSDPIEGNTGGIPLEVLGIENYEGASGDVIPLITFPDGVTDDHILDLFPSDQWDYDDTLATLTVDNLGVRLTYTAVTELVWDGGTGSWFSTTQWDGGGVAANSDMIIDAANTDGTPTGPSAVTVDADFVDGGDGPAASVTLGAIGDSTNDARLKIDAGATLEVTGATTVEQFGKVISSLQGNDTEGTAECGVVETEDLSIVNADSIQVDWTEGSDATSMFGGVYTISEYTGTPVADFGESANAAGNIGGAYIKNTDYAVDVNGDGSLYAVEIELHAQGVGDTDLDGVVGPADLADFGLGWSPNATDKTWAEGDFDFNGNVDPADLAAFGLAWAPNGISFPSDAAVGVVPEPGTALMLLIGLAGLLLYRKRL